VLSLVAMEPPVGATADDLRDKKAEIFRSMPDANPAQYVRGQYEGYLEVPGVAEESGTETFVALRLEVDNWRWAGVPFFIRAGKALATRVTEVRLVARRPPKLNFLGSQHGDPNQIAMRVDPSPGLRFEILSLANEGRLKPVHLDMSFDRELGPARDAYERLLGAAMVGDNSLLTREDSVEETWRIVQPLMDHAPPVHHYEQGSWGPKQAAALVRGFPDWHQPWVTDDDSNEASK
jgi:glucose-6-phosphate 1-dehydrogenase